MVAFIASIARRSLRRASASNCCPGKCRARRRSTLPAVLAPINGRSVRTARLAGSSAHHPQSLAGVVHRGAFELNAVHATPKEFNLRNFAHAVDLNLNVDDLLGVLPTFDRSSVSKIWRCVEARPADLLMRPLDKRGLIQLSAQQSLGRFREDIDHGFDHRPFVRTQAPAAFPGQEVKQVPKESDQGLNGTHSRHLQLPRRHLLRARCLSASRECDPERAAGEALDRRQARAGSRHVLHGMPGSSSFR